MQLLVLALVLGIFVFDASGLEVALPVMAGWQRVALWLFPKVALWVLYTVGCRITLRRLAGSRGPKALRWLERIGWFYRTGALLLYGADLRLGILLWIRRRVLGVDTILLDEVIFMTPTLLMLAGAWWSYYPIDRRMREAALIKQLDRGDTGARDLDPRPVPAGPTPSSGSHSAPAPAADDGMVRSGGVVAGPDRRRAALFTGTMLPVILSLGGAGCVFLLAPVMIRHIWDTTALPEGDVRARLADLCRRYGVGYRELLLWRTFGGMVNAAVMGLLAPVRYILLTDALLETVPAEQVEAVMAHEVAHVHKHHLPWLVVIVGGAAAALETAAAVIINATARNVVPHLALGAVRSALNDPSVRDILAMAVAAAAWVVVFGWVSRRFERQADTFAAVHLTRRHAPDAATVDAASVQAMTAALQHVADLNHLPVTRRSWRHGSIAWRQAYLHSLVGQPISNLTINRTVRWINFLGPAMVLVLVAACLWLNVDVRWL